MPETRRLPDKTDLKQLKVQAKNLLKAYETGDTNALEKFETFHPSGQSLKARKLSDAQLILARFYGFASWPKLRAAAVSQIDLRKLIHYFETSDTQGVDEFVRVNPEILERQEVLGRAVRHGNLEMVKLMYELGARDVQKALGYTVYRAKEDIARYLISRGASMSVENEDGPIIVGACEVVNPASLRMVLELSDNALEQTTANQCFAMLLSTYCRDPEAKHESLRILTETGYELPDTPAMLSIRDVSICCNAIWKKIRGFCRGDLRNRRFIHQSSVLNPAMAFIWPRLQVHLCCIWRLNTVKQTCYTG